MDGRESMKHMVMIRDCQMAALFFLIFLTYLKIYYILCITKYIRG